jgi:hypothetical protein
MATALSKPFPTLSKRRLYEIGLWTGYVFLTNAVGATSVFFEYGRLGVPIDWWEPFVWEYSSGLVILILIPFVLAAEKRFPFTRDRLGRAFAIHFALTLPFSILHVAGMVAIRRVVYAIEGGEYDFGNVPLEFLYEWRKDALSYAFIIFVVNAYRIYREKADGEANLVQKPTEWRSEPVREGQKRFRVRHGNQEFFIAPAAVDWIEAAGNYVILHVGSRTFAMRDTLKSLEQRLADAAFARVHRSALVNVAKIARREATGDGDMLLSLENGETVRLSRRYRPSLDAALGPTLATGA